MADGYVASFDAKYHYVFWLPVTAIREADTDGNPNTHADPTWTPLQLTYPIPDHPDCPTRIAAFLAGPAGTAARPGGPSNEGAWAIVATSTS